MRFASCLQSKASHEALLNIHEEELHLLENIKRCISARIKCDRDYALALNTFSLQSHKAEKAPDLGGSLVAKAWQVMVEETEALGKLIKHNADYLATYTLEMINSLIAEKRASKKLYMDERNRIDTELLMFEDAVVKMRVEYKKCLECCRSARIKFEENYLKGKSSRRMDDVKDKYVKTCRKLHQTHNDYMLLLNEAAQYERDFRTVLLPDLLEFHHNVQEELAQQCKLVLLDYIQYTDLTKDRFQQMQTRMLANVEGILPSEEYRSFIEMNKSAPTLPIIFVFDHDLIEDYSGRLKPNQLVVDDFTYNVLRDRMFELEERLKDCHSVLNDKQDMMMHFERELEVMRATVNVSPNMVLIKKRAIDILRRESNELRCAEEKLKKQYNIITTSLLSVGIDGLPPGLDLPNDIGCSMEQVDFNSMGRPRNIVDVLRKPFLKRAVITNLVWPSPLLSFKDVVMESSEIVPPHDPLLMANQLGRPLTDEEWFHGVLPREEVVRLLVNEGDFLVRETLRNEERQIVLSVCWMGHKHFIIQTTPEGLFRFEGPSFPTIQELIAFQQRSSMCVTSKSGAVLKNPVFRERWELNNDDVELLTKIGRGNFGDVYRARIQSTGEEVAVKTCRITLPDEQKKKFLLEGRILKQYNHPNIVRFIGICVQKQPIMIVMELVPGGSLLNFLRSSALSLLPTQKLVMCVNAAAGMDYLESRNCIHRDLAARNCLIGADNVVKISDFGMSREEEEYIVSDGMKQIPIKWTAPEALNFGKYTCVCDVWSFGVLMWEVYSGGNTPYNGITNAKAREMIDAGYRMPAPDGTPDEVYHLMLRCWEYNPDRRPHFAEVHANLQLLLSSAQQSSAMSICEAREGLGGVPDEPHAVNVAASSCISEGSGVGKVKEPPGTFNNEIPPLIPLTDVELNKIREDAVTIVFKMQVTQHMEVQWETVFWGRILYIQVPNAILPEGPKEGFVSLLEYAEEKLKCTHVVVCFKKERFDRACLIRTFMYLGFVMLAPGHELAPTTNDYLYMAYIIE